MAKDNRDTLLRNGNQLLKDWGAPEDTTVSSIARLQDFIGRDAAADLAIAARLGAIVDGASATALLDLEKRSSDKNVHKEVRRALYRLEQRKITVTETAPDPSPAPMISQSIEGYVSPIDGNGDRLVWLVKARPSGIAHLYAVINDPLGLREVDLVEASRKMLREARESMLQRHEIAMVETDWHYCDFLIDRAVHWATQRKQSMHGDYGRLRSALIASAVCQMEPIIFTLLSADAIRQDARLLTESASVLDEKDMRTWFFDRPALAPYLEEIKKIEDSLIILPPAQQLERARMVEESAVEELFGGELQASWVRRLEDMAHVFHATGRGEVARRACAAALALESSSQGGRGIPFCETLVRAGILFWQRADQQEQSEQASGHLVLTPQQALRESQQRR